MVIRSLVVKPSSSGHEQVTRGLTGIDIEAGDADRRGRDRTSAGCSADWYKRMSSAPWPGSGMSGTFWNSTPFW